MDKKINDKFQDLGNLPNGCHLYRKLDESVNAYIYYSDEIGGGVEVWNTALVHETTLLAAILCEFNRKYIEHIVSNGWKQQQDLSQEKLAGTNIPICSMPCSNNDDK